MKKAGPAARHRLGSTTGSEHKSRSFRSSSLPYFSGMRRSTAPPDFEADARAPGFGPMDILNPTACASASRVDRTQSPRLRSLLKVSGRTPALVAHLRSDQFRAAAAASIDFSKRGRSVFILTLTSSTLSVVDFNVNKSNLGLDPHKTKSYAAGCQHISPTLERNRKLAKLSDLFQSRSASDARDIEMLESHCASHQKDSAPIKCHGAG